MSMTAQELIAAIHHAFTKTPLPRELTARNLKSDRPYEVEHLKRSFAGKTWQQISPATLHDCGSMLMYFTPEAFCYYLPACLILTIDYDNSDFVGDTTLFFFSVDGREKAQREVLRLLTHEQRQVILQVFDYLQKFIHEHSLEEDCFLPLPSALLINSLENESKGYFQTLRSQMNDRTMRLRWFMQNITRFFRRK